MQTQAPTTWEDVLRMPGDGNRYEFIGGRLEILSPSTAHRDRGIRDRQDCFSIMLTVK